VTTSALLFTGGHPFDEPSFFDVFADIDAEVRHVAHRDPALAEWPHDVDDIDVFVFYDMPGIRFTRADPPVEFHAPPQSVLDGFAAATSRGAGLVFLHHALAGWPTWPGYADLVGGRFHYQPASLWGRDYPDSGYRHHVAHTIDVVDPSHPIVAGVPQSFTLTDELYCCPVADELVHALLRTRHDMAARPGFFSADHAIRGRRNDDEGWDHPPGSQLVGWTRQIGRSRMAYLQFGDDAVTHADPVYRRLVRNAVHWAAERSGS
jgi:uncharacterized protein